MRGKFQETDPTRRAPGTASSGASQAVEDLDDILCCEKPWEAMGRPQQMAGGMVKDSEGNRQWV